MDGKLFSVQGIQDDEGDQLFRKMEWSVVVGAVADEDRQVEGVAPCADQMVAGCLGGGVG